MTERLDRLGLDPIAALARLAQHAEAEGDLELAERAWRGLLPYAGPRPTLPRESFSAPEKAPSTSPVEPDMSHPENHSQHWLRRFRHRRGGSRGGGDEPASTT
jgi:hypothetical protein